MKEYVIADRVDQLPDISNWIARLSLTLRHALALWRVLNHPKNRKKGGWDHLSAHGLLICAEQEMEELRAAAWGYEQGVMKAAQVESEAADVSAYVAMVADRCRSTASKASGH